MGADFKSFQAFTRGLYLESMSIYLITGKYNNINMNVVIIDLAHSLLQPESSLKK